jgi:hypothetical protein
MRGVRIRCWLLRKMRGKEGNSERSGEEFLWRNFSGIPLPLRRRPRRAAAEQRELEEASARGEGASAGGSFRSVPERPSSPWLSSFRQQIYRDNSHQLKTMWRLITLLPRRIGSLLPLLNLLPPAHTATMESHFIMFPKQEFSPENLILLRTVTFFVCAFAVWGLLLLGCSWGSRRPKVNS